MRAVIELCSLVQLSSSLTFPDQVPSDLYVICVHFASFIYPICIS